MGRKRSKTPTVDRRLLALAVAMISLVALGGCASEGEQGQAQESEVEQETNAPGELEKLGTKDAVGQMFVVGMSGTEPDYYIEKMIRERNIGGVLLFGPNMESEEQTWALVGALQELSMQTGPPIPLFVAVDHEGGVVQSAPWVSAQPSAAEVGEEANPEEARRIAEEIGRALRQGGVNTNLAPVVDTGFGAAIFDRSYGEDPSLVAEMGVASIEGFERVGVVSAAKHFPNHGPALEDSHTGRPRVDHSMETVVNQDLPPFQAAIDAGVPMVMASHLVYPAIDSERPASLSPAAMQLLREELGFDGIIVTDDLAMEGATRGGTVIQAAVAAVKAGADLLVISGPPEEQAAAYDALVAAVESGEVPRERIDASLERIKRVKDQYPLYSESRGK